MDDKRNMRGETKPQTSRKEGKHNILMENREKISLTGVLNVENFNESEVVLETELGMLTIKGDGIHISRLNVETGDLIIDGNIDLCMYSQKQDFKTKGAGLLSKLFK